MKAFATRLQTPVLVYAGVKDKYNDWCWWELGGGQGSEDQSLVCNRQV